VSLLIILSFHISAVIFLLLKLKQSNPDFPLSWFGNTPVNYGRTVTCDDSAEITRYAVGEYI